MTSDSMTTILPVYHKHMDPHDPTAAWFWRRYGRDLLWLTLYGLLNVVAFVIRFHQIPVATSCGLGYGPAIAKANAQVILINIPLVLLAVCHRLLHALRVMLLGVISNNRWLWLLELPTIKPIPFHKITGSVILMASIFHSIAWFWMLRQVQTCTQELTEVDGLAYRLRFMQHASFISLLQYLPIWTGVGMILCVAVVLPFLLRWARQRHFHLFSIIHRAVFGPFLLMLIIHGLGKWTSPYVQTMYWTIPPLVMVLIERIRRVAAKKSAEIVDFSIADETIHLVLKPKSTKPLQYPAGAFVYIQVPSISSFEWHPFSVVPTTDPSTFGLKMRMVGDWTMALASHLQDQSSRPDVCIDGPIGSVTQFYHHYSDLVLIATGVGITPFLSVLHRILIGMRSSEQTSDQTKRIHLVWITNEPAYFKWLYELLDQFPAEVARLDVQIDLFSTHKGPRVPCAFRDYVTIHCNDGRPDWSTVLTSTNTSEADRAVFICASPFVTTQIKTAIASAMKAVVAVYAEAF